MVARPKGQSMGDPLLSYTSPEDFFTDLGASSASSLSSSSILSLSSSVSMMAFDSTLAVSPPSPPWSDIMDLTPTEEDIVNSVLTDDLKHSDVIDDGDDDSEATSASSPSSSSIEIDMDSLSLPEDLTSNLVKFLDVYEDALRSNESHLSYSPKSMGSSMDNYDERASLSDLDDEDDYKTAVIFQKHEAITLEEDEEADVQFSLESKLLNGNQLKSSTNIRPVSNYHQQQQQVGHCSVCKLVFTSPKLLAAHFETYVKQRLTCCQCGMKFISNSRLISHHRRHSREKPFKCQSCGKFYTHRATLVKHQLHYCPTLRAKCEDLSPSTSRRSQPSNNDEPQLPLSDSSLSRPNETCLFKEPSPIVATKTDSVLLLLPQCSTFEVSAIPNPTNDNGKSPTTTTTIISPPPSQSKQKRSDIKVENIHATNETKCRICQKEFYDPKSLHHHVTYNLTNRSCCLCHKVLGNKSKLLTHHRSHTKESPYECQVCGKRFSENSTLRKHEATHGAKQFHCDVCDKAFARKDYLIKHRQLHQQTFRCSECSFVCHSESDIANHVDMHKHTKDMGMGSITESVLPEVFSTDSVFSLAFPEST